MTDSIERQAAIDEANAWLLDCLGVTKQDRSCGLIRRLEDLSSVQPEITLELAIDYLYKIGWMQEHDRILTESARPEIIRCKDCEYFLPPHGCGHIDGMVTADENRFCSYAKQKGENDGEMRN